ncbi:MAG: hypothetical protein AAF417_18700 [Pseudomonadota bacterium]
MNVDSAAQHIGAQGRFALAASLAGVLVANVALFAPFALYAGNREEFSVALADILIIYTAPSAAFITLCGGIGILLKDRFKVYVAVLVALACLTWAQANILVWNYGELDGSPIPWLETAWRGIADTCLWTLTLVAAVWFSHRVGRHLITGAICTFGIQIIVTGLALQRGDVAPHPRQQEPYDPVQHQAMFRFSSERNVLHIVMDGFQSDVFADIIRDPGNQRIVDALSGFTFFRDNMGLYPYTQMTIPLLVSGKKYRNEVPTDQFLDDTMRGSTILNTVENRGFEVDIASQPALAGVYSLGEHTNVFNVPVGQHASAEDYTVSDAVRLMDLSLFRVSPHFVKAYIYQDDMWFLKRFSRDDAYLRLRYFSELMFLGQVEENLVVDRTAPVYKLFHLMLSHRPTVGNEQCEFDNVKRPGRLAVTLQARCGLLAIVGVLDSMKAAGIYDDSVIVLMADHGAWLPARGYEVPPGSSAPPPVTAGLAVPTLAIKPAGASGPISVSNAPTSIEDVPTTVAERLGLANDLPGSSVFELQENEYRTRRFYNYAYGKNGNAPGYLNTLLEYEVVGSPFDAGSWQPQRRFRPGGAEELLSASDP